MGLAQAADFFVLGIVAARFFFKLVMTSSQVIKRAAQFGLRNNCCWRCNTNAQWKIHSPYSNSRMPTKRLSPALSALL